MAFLALTLPAAAITGLWLFWAWYEQDLRDWRRIDWLFPLRPVAAAIPDALPRFLAVPGARMPLPVAGTLGQIGLHLITGAGRDHPSPAPSEDRRSAREAAVMHSPACRFCCHCEPRCFQR